MEVFLSSEATQSLLALTCGSSSTITDGILIGHKRGGLFFIENTLPTQKGFFSTMQKFYELNERLEDRILGFYSFQTDESKVKKILAPFAYGKIYLRCELDRDNRLDPKPFVVEHDGNFYLLPINLKSVR